MRGPGAPGARVANRMHRAGVVGEPGPVRERPAGVLTRPVSGAALERGAVDAQAVDAQRLGAVRAVDGIELPGPRLPAVLGGQAR